MSYSKSYDSAMFRHFQFLLDEFINLSNMVPKRISTFGRPPDFPLPALCLLFALKFDSGYSYRTFVSQLSLTPHIFQRLDHKKPPPKNVAVDSTGFSHSTGGDWMSLRFNKTWKRRLTALHEAVDTDALIVHSVRVRARPGGDVKEMIPLLNQVPTQDIKNVYGDKAYISRRNVQFIADLGAYPGIEPKRGLRGKTRGLSTAA